MYIINCIFCSASYTACSYHCAQYINFLFWRFFFPTENSVECADPSSLVFCVDFTREEGPLRQDLLLEVGPFLCTRTCFTKWAFCTKNFYRMPQPRGFSLVCERECRTSFCFWVIRSPICFNQSVECGSGDIRFRTRFEISNTCDALQSRKWERELIYCTVMWTHVAF